MTGHEEGCVDDEGWYYAVDFNWLKHPPAPGAGRFKRVRHLFHQPSQVTADCFLCMARLSIVSNI